MFEQALGVGDGQGSLACCSPWGHKELNMTEWLNWTDKLECLVCQIVWFLWWWALQRHASDLPHHIGSLLKIKILWVKSPLDSGNIFQPPRDHIAQHTEWCIMLNHISRVRGFPSTVCAFRVRTLLLLNSVTWTQTDSILGLPLPLSSEHHWTMLAWLESGEGFHFKSC